MFRPADNRLVRPVIFARDPKRADMKNADNYHEIIEVAPGEPLVLKPDASGCQLGATPDAKRRTDFIWPDGVRDAKPILAALSARRRSR